MEKCGGVQHAVSGVETSYPLSPMQQGMLYHSLSGRNPGVEIEQLVVEFSEDLETDAFAMAWQRVVSRHAILRTAFRWDNLDRPIQEVRRDVQLEWTRHDWRGLSVEHLAARFDAFLEEDRRRGFAMDRAPLMRFALLWLRPHQFRFVWTFHHALLDGRSFPLVLNEVFAFYAAFRDGKELELPAPRPYRDYIDWLEAHDWSKAEDFWRQTLKGFTTTTPLAGDRQKRSEQTSEAPVRIQNAPGNTNGSDDRVRSRPGGAQQTALSEASTSALKSLASENQVTMNTLVQGAWALLLSRYTGRDEVLFGATRACRRSSVPEAESMIGIFINTLPMRVRLEPQRRLLPWLSELRQQWISQRDYEHTPLVRIQSCSDLPPGSALFDTIVVFENSTLDSMFRPQGDSRLVRRFSLHELPSYPMTLAAYADKALLLKLEYDRARFTDGTIARMLEHLRTILEGFAKEPHGCLADVPLLTDAERHQLLEEWSPRHVDFKTSATLHELFESEAERRPHSVAIVCDNQSLNYCELNQQANRLARQLRASGVGPEVRVGLCLERSIEMITSILAILKAGGAYVPIDLSYPADRVAFILKDAKTPVLLTQTKLLSRLPAHEARVICVDAFAEQPSGQSVDGASLPRNAGSKLPLAPTAGVPTSQVAPNAGQENSANPQSGAKPDNLAYVIYTSGSTGVPKGVMVTHQNVLRLFQATDAYFHFNPKDVWTCFHSYAFDFSVWEIWGALLYGGKLIIVPYLLSRSPEEFHELLVREGVTILNQTPSAFVQLLQAEAEAMQRIQSLAVRSVIFGGEALDLAKLKPWFDRHGDQRPQLVNMFGITETTVHVTYRPLTKSDLGSGSVIGGPIPNLQVYVLDARLRPVPIGVAGELYVGGAGLGRGYLNRPELTADRFIPHPFSAEPGARLYRTGDLARWLPDRDLEYLGRIDDQVKIRGFRIELGEIESVLRQHPSVRDAVVLAREETPGQKRLIGFCITRKPAPSDNALRDWLSEKLPDYMVPATFVAVDAFPLTANGKIDRQALAAIEAPTRSRNAEFESPRTEIERAIAQVWEQALRVEHVGLDSSFFELGGNSLVLVQVHSRLRNLLHRDLSITQLFQYPTVRSLSNHLRGLPISKPSHERAVARAQRHTNALAQRRQLAEAAQESAPAGRGEGHY